MVNHGNDLNMSASFTTGLIRPQHLNNSSCSIYKSSSAETLSGGKAVHVSKECGYKDCDAAQAPVSSRWNPTPEQVEVLKEMFRLGTRSPTAEHIQQITTLLRRFGRVEGKNVFYWFQNHKARERQRRRREKLEISSQEQRCHITESRERKKSGVIRGACCEVEEKSNWGPISISKFNLLEEPLSIHRTQTSCCGNGWTQIERGLHHMRRSLSSSSTQLDAPNTRDQQHRQYEMLELFPLGNGSNNVISEEVSITTTTMSTSLSSSQIVEFLPPKI